MRMVVARVLYYRILQKRIPNLLFSILSIPFNVIDLSFAMFCICLFNIDRLTAGIKTDIPTSKASQFMPITAPSGQTCPLYITFKGSFVLRC